VRIATSTLYEKDIILYDVFIISLSINYEQKLYERGKYRDEYKRK